MSGADQGDASGAEQDQSNRTARPDADRRSGGTGDGRHEAAFVGHASERRIFVVYLPPSSPRDASAILARARRRSLEQGEDWMKEGELNLIQRVSARTIVTLLRAVQRAIDRDIGGEGQAEWPITVDAALQLGTRLGSFFERAPVWLGLCLRHQQHQLRHLERVPAVR